MRPAVRPLPEYLHDLILKWMQRKLYLSCRTLHGFTQHNLTPLTKLYLQMKHVRHKWHILWSYQLYYPFEAWPGHKYISPLCHACLLFRLPSSSRLRHPNKTTLHQIQISKERDKIDGVCLCSRREGNGEYIQDFDSKTFKFFMYEIIRYPSLCYDRRWYHSPSVILLSVCC